MQPVLALLALALASMSAAAADIEVEVRGVRPGAGQIHAALFDNANDFMLDLEVRAMLSASGEVSPGIFTREADFPSPPQQKLDAAPSSRTVRLHFTDLALGEYAVAVYQDRNGDNKLDTTFAREPLEPWGMSNNPRPRDRAPTWDEAKFTLPAEGARLVIELH
jgi:uncharacterized protein (DUF2141 family)